MLISMLRSKIHRAVVTGADVNYRGSITIDLDIIERAQMYPYELVMVADVENGQRFETYIIPGERGSRMIQLNGAAARLVSIGDHVIIMAFGLVEAPPPADYEPVTLQMNDQNEVMG